MLTVADVLRLEPLRKTQLRVLAAPNALENEVSWVHISEMERLAHIFHGKELLLTQGRGIPRTPARQREWVDSLADVGVAGVAIEDGHVFDVIPDALVDRASERELPLIQLSRPAYFMEITRAVHSTIVNSQHDALVHADRLGKRLSRLVMAGGNVQETMDEVASALSHPVALTGPTHMLQAFSPRDHDVLARVPDWRRHTKDAHDLRATSEARCARPGADDECLYLPIVYQGTFWGCVHVLLGGRPPTEMTLRVLDQAVMALGLAFAVQQDTSALASDIRSEIVRELLTTAKPHGQDFAKRLQWAGFMPEDEVRVLIAEPLDPDAATRTILNERRRLEALVALRAELERRLPDGTLVGVHANRIVAVVPEELSLVGLEGLSTGSGVTAVVGCSAKARVTALVRAGRDAADALKYALQIGHRTGVYRAEHLGLERLLLKLDEDGALRELVENELGGLLDHDAESRIPLLETLEALFVCGGRKSEVARVLHIDRRTAHHRVNRIERIIGDGFSHPDKQLSLHLAVRGFRFLRGRADN